MHKVAEFEFAWAIFIGAGEDPFDPRRHPTLRIFSRFMSIEDHDDRPATETITITVSGQFVEHARRLATLFGYGPGELGEALESLAGWWLQALHEDDGGELTAAAESHFWRSELACSEFAERLRQRIPEATIEVLREHRGWSVEVTPPGMILRDSGQAVA